VPRCRIKHDTEFNTDMRGRQPPMVYIIERSCWICFPRTLHWSFWAKVRPIVKDNVPLITADAPLTCLLSLIPFADSLISIFETAIQVAVTLPFILHRGVRHGTYGSDHMVFAEYRLLGKKSNRRSSPVALHDISLSILHLVPAVSVASSAPGLS
jgi:hypothetical protein